jgi:hypothetical protein
MSRTFRHEYGVLHFDNKCPESAGGGCNWCITGLYKRIFNRQQRHNKKKIVEEAK